MTATKLRKADKADEIDIAAAALYEHRYKASNGPWPLFCAKKPDVAAIYVKNAQVAIAALDRYRNGA